MRSFAWVVSLSLTWALAAPAVAQVGPNLARGKPAKQSSTAHGGDAARATDGRTDGNYAAGSVTHTGGEAGWLEIDLGATTQVATVVIHNRTDCCGERLRGAHVELSAQPCATRAPLAERIVKDPGPRNVLDFAGMLPARYLCVRHSRAEYLSVAEVEAYGDAIAVGPGFYQLVHEPSGQLLTIDGIKDGTVAHASPRRKDESQRFFLRPWTDGQVVIAAQKDGWQVLSSNTSWTGDPVRAWAWTTSKDQLWTLHDAGGGGVRIRHREKGQFLALAGSQVVLHPTGDVWRYAPDLDQCQYMRQFDGELFVYALGPGKGLGVAQRGTYPEAAGLFRWVLASQRAGGRTSGGVGFESCLYQGHFIRIDARDEVVLARDDGSEAFFQSSGFLWPTVQARRMAFYLASRPDRFLRTCGNRLVLDGWDEPDHPGCPGDRWTFARESQFLAGNPGFLPKP